MDIDFLLVTKRGKKIYENLVNRVTKKYFSKYSSKLKSDALFIFDGPKHPSNLPTLTFGARGISDIRLITYGPIVPQHSGHFGNYAPNPVFRMSEILSSMKDKDGRVVIEGFYDGVTLDKETQAILAGVPDDEKKMMEDMQFNTFDNVGSNNPKRVIDIINTIQNKIKKGQPLFGEISMRKDEQMKYFPT